jgi:hypothetical protein
MQSEWHNGDRSEEAKQKERNQVHILFWSMKWINLGD